MLGATFSETFEAVDGGYVTNVVLSPSGVRYNVVTEVFWSDYDDRVVRVMVCVDDGGPSATRPLCESLEFGPPNGMSDV